MPALKSFVFTRERRVHHRAILPSSPTVCRRCTVSDLSRLSSLPFSIFVVLRLLRLVCLFGSLEAIGSVLCKTDCKVRR